jgi:hypothetical protein
VKCLKGAKYLPNCCCFYWQIPSFVVLSICLSLKMILFESLIFSECWQLNTLSGNLEPNFIWGFLCSTHIIFVPSNVSHSRKEMGNSFVVKFFHRKWIIIEQRLTDNTIRLGIPMATPRPINSSICILFLPCFLSTTLPLHKLERLHLVFIFFAYFVLNKYTTTCSYTLYLWNLL